MFTALRNLFLVAALVQSLSLAQPGYAFDYEDLTFLIESNNLTSVEQVIAHLPQPFLENYTLAYDSRSLHGSSYDYPRAVLFGTDATLVLTFNGDPAHARYQHVEAMQFRQQSNEFEMRSISFEDDAHLSAKNPPLCLSCHGNRPRPIWSSYSYADIEEQQHWPGFYGSMHDAPSLDSVEAEAYANFQRLATRHPRYRYLKFSHAESKWYPYGDGPYEHRFRPNNRLGNLLARLNARRVATDLMQKEFFLKYPNISLLWLLQCDQAEEDDYLAFVKSVYDGSYTALSDIRLAQYHSKSAEQVAFVFEKLLSGLDVYTWNLSLDPQPDDERFFTGMVSIDELVAAAVLQRLPDTHWIHRYFLPWTNQQLYETFQPGYYAANIAPGGIGNVYDMMGLFFDRDRAKQACARLQADGRKEAVITKADWQ